MIVDLLRKRNRLRTLVQPLVLISATLVTGAVTASAQSYFSPGNLVVSRSVYDNNPNNVQVGQILPPNCQVTQGGCAGAATNDGTYPYVWNNDLVDGSFGITSETGAGSVHASRHSGQLADRSQRASSGREPYQR